MKPSDFIAAIAPAARASAQKTGIPASFTIAQAALESGWGSSGLCAKACNLFGVKADSAWVGDIAEMPTREFLAGQWVTVNAKWRKYTDWLACINDRADFFRKNKRYRLAMTGKRSGEDFARQIALAGYATDPKYAEKLCSIIRRHGLSSFDTESCSPRS